MTASEQKGFTEDKLCVKMAKGFAWEDWDNS